MFLSAALTFFVFSLHRMLLLRNIEALELDRDTESDWGVLYRNSVLAAALHVNPLVYGIPNTAIGKDIQYIKEVREEVGVL